MKYLKYMSLEFFLTAFSFCIALRFVELGLGLLAVIPLILLLRFAFKDGSIEARLLAVAWILGNIFCWVIGFLGCFYLLSPIGYQIGKYTITTMVLINLVTWASLLGSLIALPLKIKGNKIPFSTTLPEKLTMQAVKITASIFIIFLFANYLSGALYSRSQVGNSLDPGSALYFLSGFSVLQYLLFFYLGTSLDRPLFSNRNIFYISILIFCIALAGLTGGREGSIRMLFFFIGGSLYSRISLQNVKSLILYSLPVFLAIVLVIGAARSSSIFLSANVGTRFTILFQSMSGQIEKQGNDYDSSLYLLFTRMTEPTGQLVIDRVVESPKYIGIKNFERIENIFIPKIFNLNKKPPDDGPERLKNYGVRINKFTSAPLTFMADSFERGGHFIVFIASLVVSFCLTCIGKFVSKLKNSLFRTNLIVSLSFVCLRLYTPTILGAISYITYGFMRDVVLIWLVVFVVNATVEKHKAYY